MSDLPAPYYQDDAVTIYHGDCREIIPLLPPVDLVLTDPPYGISHSSNHVAPTTTAKWMKKTIQSDGDLSARDFVLAGRDEWAVFASPKGAPPHGHRGILIWDKGPASGMGDLSFPWKPSWELIYVCGKLWKGRRDEGVIKGHHIVTRASMGRTHPNEKPVPLLSHLMSKHSATLVLDPFCGTGSTLRAAKDLGRKAIGIEIEEKYCEIAARRMRQEVLL